MIVNYLNRVVNLKYIKGSYILSFYALFLFISLLVLNKCVVWICCYISLFSYYIFQVYLSILLKIVHVFWHFYKVYLKTKSPRSLTARVKLRETCSLTYICYIAIKLINKVYVRQEFLQQKQRSIFRNRKGKTKIMTYVPISVFLQFPFCGNFRRFLLFSTMLQI